MYRTSTFGSVALLLSFLFFSSPVASPLPEKLGEWNRTEERTYSGQTLYEYIDGGADLYLEYGFISVAAGYYQLQEREILVEVYSMSTPLAAAGLYTHFRDHTAADLPAPYTGKMYDMYLECLNGKDYIKLVSYDSLGIDEGSDLLGALLPEPAAPFAFNFNDVLPGMRIAGSEVLFNGPIALKNFCLLGRKNLFGVGKRTRAYGCLIDSGEKEYKWITVLGRSDQIQQDLERFLAYQSKQDYTVRSTKTCHYLEDQLGGGNMALVQREERLFALFGVGDEDEAARLLTQILQ